MAIPISQMWTVASYVARQHWYGRSRYPLVLMLEPLYRCNLACAGCGKIQYPGRILKSQLAVGECLAAADECGAPVVSIAGGEPLLHPQIEDIAAGLVAQRRYVYLCTNGLLLAEKLDRFTPSKYLSFSIHLDGLEAEHDAAVCRRGTYAAACEAVRAAVARGFRVTSNTTLFEGADPDRTRAFFDEMMRIGVEGLMISPGYSYRAAPDQDHFLTRRRTRALFQRILAAGARRWRFNQSPLFLEFLAGGREYECTPWGNPTYTIFGWQKPCYLLQDGYAHTFAELLEQTEWSRYGHRSGNPKCQDCMVHSGFEASAIADAFSTPSGMLAMARAFLFGPRVPDPDPSVPSAVEPCDLDHKPERGTVKPVTPESIRAAFDYRGDVTLMLDDDSTVEGFVTNVGASVVEVWAPGATGRVEIPLERLRTIAFTGRDAA